MKQIFKLLILLGAILLYGTAGASDAGTIDWTQTLLQVSIAFTMIGVGIIGQKVLDKIEDKRIKRPGRPIPRAFYPVVQHDAIKHNATTQNAPTHIATTYKSYHSDFQNAR